MQRPDDSVDAVVQAGVRANDAVINNGLYVHIANAGCFEAAHIINRLIIIMIGAAVSV